MVPRAPPLPMNDVGPFEEDPEPRWRGPCGVVVLPSPRLDHVDERWLEIFLTKVSVSVNLAHLSKRLRDANALPRNVVALDNPKFRASRELSQFGLAAAGELERCWREPEDITTWGAYDFWFRRKKINHRKRILDTREEMPEWQGPDECGPDGEGVYTFAGQYTSCAACNLVAMLLGWHATVVVLGNRGGTGYCELCMPTTAWWDRRCEERYAERGPSCADDRQWGYLRQRALEHGTEIVHAGDSPTRTVPRVTEEEALDWLTGDNSGKKERKAG